MGRSLESVRMGVKVVSARWLKGQQSILSLRLLSLRLQDSLFEFD